jgi:integrase
MASLFEHPRSKFFFVQFRGTDGKVHRKSLKIEQGTTQARREALKEVAEITARELSRSTFNDASRWEAWVINFLEMHYKGRDKTLVKYRSCWEKVYKFLVEEGIRYPAQVKYSLAEKYMRWRMADGAHHNTARLDLVLFSMVMKQAVRLEFAQGNPFAQLGIERVEPKEKAEITDADIDVIREALKTKAEWMQLAFEIALHTGCRLSDTSIYMKDIDLERRTITFQKPKGGKKRAFTTKFSTGLVPLLERLKADGREKTLELPQKNYSYPEINTNNFSRFFKALHKGEKLSDSSITFHSTRVTFITRHARARTDERIVKKLVNHSSTLVHQIYSRLKAEDATDKELEIGLPAPIAPPTQQPSLAESSPQLRGAPAPSKNAIANNRNQKQQRVPLATRQAHSGLST